MKKYMKRMLSALLAMLMLGGSIALTPMESKAASNSYIETSLTTSGSTATLKVNLRNYRYLTNGKFVINYDSNVLSVRSTTKGSGTYTSFDIAEVGTQNAGEIVYGFASGTQSYKYGTLFQVDFDIKNVSRQDTTVRTQIAELVNAGTHYTTGETTLSDTISVGTEVVQPVTNYTVTYYSQNQVYTTQTVEEGKTATRPADPQRAGYTFKGWYITSYEAYQTDYYKWDFSDPIYSNRSLYAGWEVATVTPEPEPEPVTTYRVTFYNQNQVYTTQNVASGGYAKEPAAPTRAGYKFKGWYITSVERYQTDYYKWYFNSDRVTNNTSLYAGWEVDSTPVVNPFPAPTITNISKYYILWTSRVQIQWSRVADAYGYEIYRSTSQNGTYSYITTANYTYAYDSTARAGTTYYYKVRAYKYNGNTKVYSEYSAPYAFRP